MEICSASSLPCEEKTQFCDSSKRISSCICHHAPRTRCFMLHTKGAQMAIVCALKDCYRLKHGDRLRYQTESTTVWVPFRHIIPSSAACIASHEIQTQTTPLSRGRCHVMLIQIFMRVSARVIFLKIRSYFRRRATATTAIAVKLGQKPGFHKSQPLDQHLSLKIFRTTARRCSED